MAVSLQIWCIACIGRKYIWNGRELLCSLSRSSICLRFPTQGKHGDLASRLVHQRQDNLQIIVYWQELQVHLKMGKIAKYDSLRHEECEQETMKFSLVRNQVYRVVLCRRQPKQTFQRGKTFYKQQWSRRLWSKLNESLLVIYRPGL